MRLIDGDALEETLRGIRTEFVKHPTFLRSAIEEGIDRGVGAAVQAINDASTIDAVPVVRCCECKWHYPEYTGELMCTNCPKGQEETFFCAGGRRRDGQTG